MLDPSRVAAQVASGIGFIGGGLIFVRRDAVRGLTTAAGVWVTSAVGLAAGAGLALLATATTLSYFVVAFAFPAAAGRLPRPRWAVAIVQVTYVDGRGVLRDAIARCTGTASRWPTSAPASWTPTAARSRSGSSCTGPVKSTQLAASLSELDGVLSVSAERPGRSACSPSSATRT